MRQWILAGMMAVLLGAAATTSPSTKPDMSPRVMEGSVVRKDVAYVENAAGKQRLDIYAPANVQGAPVLIFIHGGEWTKGDKSEVSFKPKFLNEHGVVFVSVNYRLSGTDKHPAQAEDVASAVKWVRDHAGELGGDAGKIVLMGHSAGCHLVTLVGLDERWLEKVGMKPGDLAGVVSWSGGAFDLVEKVKGGGTYEGYIKANFGEDEKVWKEASPAGYVGRAKGGPPFLFASAETGNPASKAASDAMVRGINDAGGHAESIVLVGKDHTLANHEIGMTGDVSGEQLLAFVRQCTGK